ncbi:hypothetical protein [Nocardia sp. CA-135398]|uniref:hypothetical protein n=1 Tax=Nocardia sp. CA-135398 TaxID=3239977 RepID=UPI003D95534B
MITPRLVRLGLPTLILAATTTGLVTAPTATAQALPTYTCKYTQLTPFGSVKGRECTAAAGAPLSGWHILNFQIENSETGERWLCRDVEAAIIPYYMDKVDPSYSDFERAYGRGADAGTCDRILD